MFAVQGLISLLVIATSAYAFAQDSSADEYNGLPKFILEKLFHEAKPEDIEAYQENLRAKDTSPKWQKGLPPLADLNPRTARVYIHMHSIYSHDACDKKPFNSSGFNQKCLNDFLSGLCQLNADVVFLTEHRKHLSEVSFDNIWSYRPSLRPIVENGMTVGAEEPCGEHHSVKLFMGAENATMPLGLLNHPQVLPGKNLEQTYNSSGVDAIEGFRRAGALVGLPHTENKSYTVDFIRERQFDFLEIYNLHAEFMFLLKSKNPLKWLTKIFDVLAFSTNKHIEPDLAFLAFHTENSAALKKWAQVSLSQKIMGVAGSDAHQNVLKLKMFDGERMDSYRRSLRWFSNFVETDGNPSRQNLLASIKAGRIYSVFEVYGTPVGFRFQAGQKSELVLDLPALHNSSSYNEQPKIEGRIMQATEGGWIVVSAGAAKQLRYQGQAGKVYRAEIRIVPNHLKKSMPGLWHLNRVRPWIYSNPIWL